jgi:hypothetical protein
MEKKFHIEGKPFLIRSYSARDEQGVLSLWQAAFHKEMPPDLWRWKYMNNPYTQKLLVCSGRDESIVALFGGIPHRANREGRSVEILHATDIMSHPDYRGTGLFVRTCNAFMEFFGKSGGVDFLYGLPGRYHFDLGEKYLGYREVKGCLSFLNARTADLAYLKKELGGRLTRIRELGPSMDRLWAGCLGDYPLSVVRDASFLQWRFGVHPLNDYEIWGYQSWLKRGIQAYAVLHTEGDTAQLVDVLAPSSSKLIRDFLGRIGLNLAKRGIETLKTWLPATHFVTAAAISSGFELAREPLGVILTVRLFDHSPSLGWLADNMFFTMADGDLF